MQMVNAEFPDRARYGFEMVDAPALRFFCGVVAINRKFTPNPIDRIFLKFSAI
jgi:hypothetical protein